jgi:hypothetical protein
VIIMASIAELIDFIMNLMRDDKTRTEFERDPDAALADRGLAGVTGQDVRDARLMMTDCGAAQPRADRPAHGGSGGGADPIREIHYTTTNFAVGDVTTTVISVQDNDTVIVDSFNTDVTAVQDNDTIDVVNIEDDDTEIAGEEPGEEGAESGAAEGVAPDSGTGPEAELGFGGELGVGSGPSVGSGEELGGGLIGPPGAGSDGGLAEGSESELDGLSGGVQGERFTGDLPTGSGAGEDLPDVDSGADEGFAPGLDPGFGAQPELGVETGPVEEPADDFDVLAG